MGLDIPSPLFLELTDSLILAINLLTWFCILFDLTINRISKLEINYTLLLDNQRLVRLVPVLYGISLV